MGALDGQVAIVTGAASGIGAAIADLFLSEGAAVLLADRDAERLTRAAEEHRGRQRTVATAAGGGNHAPPPPPRGGPWSSA
jgi:NADP-dependent 3-hydroxy acid dehydrogenase YdfG